MTLHDRYRIFRDGALRYTIWGPGSVDHIPARYRALVQFAYPMLYAITFAIYGAIGSFTGGSTTLQQAIHPPWSNALCSAIGAASLIALMGVSFGGGNRTPTGQQVERLGNLLMIPPVIAYFWILCTALGAGSSAPLAALQGTVLVIMFSVLRIFDLSREIGKRAAHRKVK